MVSGVVDSNRRIELVLKDGRSPAYRIEFQTVKPPVLHNRLNQPPFHPPLLNRLGLHHLNDNRVPDVISRNIPNQHVPNFDGKRCQE